MDEPTPPSGNGDGPVDGWIVPPARPRSGLEKVALVIAVVAFLILAGAFVFGFVSAFFADRNAAPPALGAMFGRPYEELPADYREGIDARLMAVAPADWDQRTEAQRSAWAIEQVDDGLVRLDDATLVRLVQIGTAAETHAPVAACAEIAKGPRVLSRASDEAVQLGLSPEQRMERAEIHMEAIEAQVHNTPAPRTVSEAEGERVDAAIVGLMTPEERKLIEGPGDDSVWSDAELCAGRRAVGAAIGRLPAADLATFARWTYRPYD